MLLVENERLAGWDLEKRVLLFEIAGKYAGVSADRHVLSVKSGQVLHFYDLQTGVELDPTGIQAAAFEEHQRMILTGKPNTDRLDLEDAFTRQTKTISLQGKLAFVLPFRVAYSPYVVVRTWYDTGYAEGENLKCYNLETGEQVFSIPSNGNCTFQAAWSETQKALGIEECGNISVHDLATGKHRVSIKRATPVNLSYRIRKSVSGENREYLDEFGQQVENPQHISSISLHPQDTHLVAIAAGKNILIMDMSFQLHNVFRNWSSGKVIHTFQVQNNIAGITFVSGGEKIASVTEEGRLEIWDIPVG